MDLDECYFEDPIGEAEKPQSLRSLVLPPQHEIDAHSLTHQPFRSWCCVCQQAKGHGGQHQEENISIIQLDYTIMNDPCQAPQRSGRQYTYTILTAIESTTGLCTASAKSILQSDAETSLMQLVSTVAADLNLLTAVSPPYSHQRQGKVERFHRNLFDQLCTTQLQWRKDLKVEPHMLPPGSLPWALQHSVFILNNYSLQGRHLTSGTTATTTAPASLVLENVFLETSGKSRHKSYVSGVNIRSSEASGLGVTSSPMSTSLHYLWSTATIHQP